MADPLLKIRRYSELSSDARRQLYSRAGLDLAEVRNTTILPLAAEFRAHSYAALTKAIERFDGQVPSPLVLGPDALESAAARVKATHGATYAAFEKAAANIRAFHEKQRQAGFSTDIAGNTLGVKFIPFDNVALYVPGGKALYPSTVLMGVLPARIAGVANITLMTPPPPESKTGRVADIVLAMAHLAGADRVLQAGGAQAIFAAAYGVSELEIKPADFIYGPGNIYVAAAKSHVAGENLCGIDSFAGPSEVVIIADDSANARFVAHDLMAQAEHDENAQALLITTSADLAARVEKEIIAALERRAEGEKRRQITLESIRRNGLVLIVDSLTEAANISNRYGPEHLEIQTRDDDAVMAQIKVAGSIFLGAWAPVAAGDYYSGTNHILPTAGAARHASGVSVYSFYRRVTWQRLSEAGLKAGSDAIALMSEAEGLFAEHGYSVLTRFE
ncbi:MAG: histidinol dehydrogenase [Spirochaetes bacterium]|nr:histidinol dehydrogenase [Spirochaetota bacterium]